MTDQVGLSALAAGLAARIGGGPVQDVRIAGPDLIVLAVRRPGHTEQVGLSLLAGACGIVMLEGSVPQVRADGLLVALRDLLRSTLVAARVERIVATSGPDRTGLRLDFDRRDGGVSLFLDMSGRGNLEVHRPGRAPQALRPPPGELPEAEDAAAVDAGLAERALLAESARVEGLRATTIHGSRLLELRQRLRRATKAARTLVERREGDVARLGQPDHLRTIADALAASLHSVTRGQSRVDVEWDGATLGIPLDPSLAAGENLRRAYARAAKAERGVQEAKSRLDEARERASALDEVEKLAMDAALASPESSARLSSLESRASKLLGPERRREAARQQAPEAASGPRTYESKDGLRILVGRSSKGNDELTFHIARGNDVWLHARGCPGPHVVLVLPKGAEIPGESLLDAATLAHVHSKLGKEPRGEVAWCRAKDVSRRKGAKAGEVMMTREKVIGLRVEPERVARLESSR